MWALTAVRDVSRVRVFSRDQQRRERFATRVGSELGLNAEAVSSPGDAVRDADIILLATRSRQPVIAVGDVRPGTHVTTVGPKFFDGQETPAELADAAAVVACDSPQQAAAYPEPFFVPLANLISLADILHGRAAGRRDRDDITLFYSVGLAGSDVLLANRALDALPGTLNRWRC